MDFKKQHLNILNWISPIVLILLWLGLTEGHIIKPLFLPSPISVFSAAMDIGLGLIDHILATFLRTIVGLILGIIVGFSWGLLMAHSSVIYSISNNIVEAWRPVPPVALAPFFLLWFGFADIGKILLVSLGVTFIVLVHTYESTLSIHPNILRSAYSLGATKRDVFFEILIPATLPKLIGGLRVASALAIGLVIVSEFMGARNGLGYLINVSKVTFSTPTILLCTIILGFMSWVIDSFIRLFMRRITFWAEYRQDTNES